MPPRYPTVDRTPRLMALLQEASGQGLNIMDEVLRQAREALQLQIDLTRDLFERDVRSRVVSTLALAAPEMRSRFPQILLQAFERELGDNPTTTSLDTGPSSLRFDQLELMDEQQVHTRISMVRGLQQVLLDAEAELAELNALVSALLGFDQVRSERNPLRPEVFLDALRGLINESQGDSLAHERWTQVMVPLLGRQLKPVYQNLLRHLRQQRVQPARYAIHRTAPHAATGHARGDNAAQGAIAGPSAATTASAGRLTVQQLHGLMSGAEPAQDADQLVQEVVNLVIANIVGDERIPAAVRQIIQGLEPALLTVARQDPRFFHNKRHPARQLLDEITQRSFGYDGDDAPGLGDFVQQLHLALDALDVAGAGTDAFARGLERLRRQWVETERRRQAQQQAAVHALQQAERRNQLARQMAEHIRAQPYTVLVPDVVVEFACGPWAQVMAQAQMEGLVDKPGEPDCVALLEDLFWSVRPDQTRQQPALLVKLIPQLVQGLRQGLERIHYPEAQTQAFLDQLFDLHQGRRSRASPHPASPPERPWLAPEEARESGFMDDLGSPAATSEPVDFPATVPAGFGADFPATEPMAIEPGDASAAAAPPAEAAAPEQALVLDQLHLGNWVELLVEPQWMRLQLVWINANATLCLFASPTGSNHSMTRRMFDRLVTQGQLRIVSQGLVVERAFDAVAEMAMRNSVYMDLQEHPGPAS